MEKRRRVKKGRWPGDFIMLFCILILTVLGVIMVFSASMYNAGVNYDDSLYYFFKQLLSATLGLGLMFFISSINYKATKAFAKPILLGCIVLLILVLIPGIGVKAGGARRWINVGIQIQPSEFTKIALILYVAYSVDKKGDLIRSFKYGFLPFMILTVLVCGLIAIEPNLSTAMIIAALVFGLLFISGVKISYLMSLVAFGVAGAAALIIKTPWRLERIFSFLDPWADATDSGWQVVQSLLALGSGGIFGQGIGNGKAKLMFMPEPQNDFIFAHIGEELGLIGGLAILLVYIVLIWRCIRVSLEAPDTFSCVFAGGMGLLLGMQVFINIGVVTNLLPVTGMQLPFVSAGASSLISLMCGMGVVLNISRYCKL